MVLGAGAWLDCWF